MNSSEFQSNNLPPILRERLHSLAIKMNCSEEEIASKMVKLVLDQCDNPEGQELRDFVSKAKEALNKK